MTTSPPIPAAAAAGPLAATSYQHISARVLGIADKLRELGVDKELEVPTLVIAGDQSSGKSSVVEAIAGVALPRSDGTCTRCPTEVQLRRKPTVGGGGSGWSAKVKLSRSFDVEGRELSDKPPVEFFCDVSDASHITACVTAAQAVLLNPTAVESDPGKAKAYVPDLSGPQPKPSTAFKALGDATRYELGFTANKVVLEILGADVDLTIIDLPGIIHDHPKGRHYVTMVEQMTKQNLAPKHHIIAMALPAGLDPETQAIRLWVREVDPAGDRSIGIITKPDTISERETTAYGKLVKLVSGGNHFGSHATSDLAAALGDHTQLQHGYYVVRNPGQEELEAGITFAAAREAEARYFAENIHWAHATVKSPALAHRLGTKNLRDGLSALLVAAIESQLPLMRRTARECLNRLEEEIARLPPPPSSTDALHELRGMLRSVEVLLDKDVHATGSGEKIFYQRVQQVYRLYGESVIRSTPAFVVGLTLVTSLADGDKAFLSAGSKQQLEPAWRDGEVQLEMYGGVTTEVEAARALAENKDLQQRLEAALFPGKHMTLEEVTALHRRYLGNELPGFSSYDTLVELIRAFKGQWADHAAKCLEDVAALTQEQAAAVVTELFGRYPKALRFIRSAMSQHIDTLTAEAAKEIRALTDIEDRDIFTLNDHYFSSQFTIFLGRLKRAYIKGPSLDYSTINQVQNLLGQLATFGYTFRTCDELLTCQPTPVDDELRMMAACLAYFKVSFKRIQDGVPLHIRSFLLRQLVSHQGLEDAVLRHLSAKTGSGGQRMEAALQGRTSAGWEEAAKELLVEEEGLAQQRVQLKGLERRLREALEVLDGDGDVFQFTIAPQQETQSASV
ncbi:hypothetical protein PLESTF_001692100 [Pleodorina starrii]|nr:hypothetical protein PLESTM_000767400 [Pleodorina starrii]GLC75829.1 hypothetical protein PLESTF_001692100 [Pleodorina starrii]